MDAYNNPRFYRQVGKDPQLLLRTALESLARKFVCEFLTVLPRLKPS
jgi:hypothetical protein